MYKIVQNQRCGLDRLNRSGPAMCTWHEHTQINSANELTMHGALARDHKKLPSTTLSQASLHQSTGNCQAPTPGRIVDAITTRTPGHKTLVTLETRESNQKCMQCQMHIHACGCFACASLPRQLLAGGFPTTPEQEGFAVAICLKRAQTYASSF